MRLYTGTLRPAREAGRVGGVLIAYRLRLIRMTRRFRGYAAAAVLGGVLLAGTDGLVAMVAGTHSLGFHSGEGLAIGALCALAGILLATPASSIHVLHRHLGLALGQEAVMKRGPAVAGPLSGSGQKWSTSTTAWANAVGASWGRLWPMPARVRCS